MAGDKSVANSAQDVRIKIGEFAAKLKDINDELSGRIDQAVGGASRIWIGDNPPTNTTNFVGWVKTSQNNLDFLYNTGTVTEPEWTTVLAKTERPDTFGVPYRTSEFINGRQVWAVDLSLGNLPNNTLKLVSIPPSVLSAWGTISERWIDVSRSYAYSPGSLRSIPLPYITLLEGSPDIPTWDRQTPYIEGTQVAFKGFAYQAKWYTQNDDPEKNSGQYDVWINLGTLEDANIPRMNNLSDVVEIYIDDDMMAVKTTSNRTEFQGVVVLKYLTSE